MPPLTWSVTVCLPVCLRNTCKTVYAPKSLSSTWCFVQKKKKAAFYHDSCFILLFDSVTFFSVIYSFVNFSASLYYLRTSALIASLTFLTVFAWPSMRKGREWQSIWPCLSVCSGTPDISSSLHHRVRSQVVEFGSRVCHSPVSFSERLMNHGQGLLLHLSCLGLTWKGCGMKGYMSSYVLDCLLFCFLLFFFFSLFWCERMCLAVSAVRLLLLLLQHEVLIKHWPYCTEAQLGVCSSGNTRLVVWKCVSSHWSPLHPGTCITVSLYNAHSVRTTLPYSPCSLACKQQNVLPLLFYVHART